MILSGKKMLKGQSIIYFGPEKWNGMWRNRHQLMTRLSIKNKVLYVEPVIRNAMDDTATDKRVKQ